MKKAMQCIGVAGYMGAGKTMCARMLSHMFKATIIDADLEAKTLMNSNTDIRARLIDTFSGAIIQDSKLSFAQLGHRAFASYRALQKLNTIVHPPLVARLQHLRSKKRDRPIIVDAALIPLWNIESWFSHCVWVSAEHDIRLSRIADKQVLSIEEVGQRMKFQEQLFNEPPEARWQYIYNNGTPDDLTVEIQKLFSTW